MTAASTVAWLPALDGVVEQLDAGIAVADVGCGYGHSTVLMAQAFPRSRFHGFDAHPPSIDEARRNAADAGVAIALAIATHAQPPGSARRASPPHVTHWNVIAIDAFAPTEGTNPMAQSRTPAILHAAIQEALNAIDRRFEAYTPGLAATPNASADAAVAAAAREVLVALVAGQASLVDTAYVYALATIPDGTAKTAGARVRAGQLRHGGRIHRGL